MSLVSEQISSSSIFNIRPLDENDKRQVLSLLLNSFFPDEPITQYLQITETSEFAKTIIDDCLHDRCSFVALNTETNVIVGICLNKIKHKNDRNETAHSDEKLGRLFQIFADLHETLNIFNALNADTLLHVFVISVDGRARRHKLSSRLIAKSIEYAQELQITGAFAEATSLVSRQCFEQQQFNVFGRLTYKNDNSKCLPTLNNEDNNQCYLVARKF
ncbi:unnamed protein product [Adineta steineri]|uniref:aralkylamine N-acetyltransferase n=1 Tax=Adineta steineri TaxID=433720 RepID=A0A818XQ57_9BILA|nr:unnamed protein product [Adineta steineri]CAF3743988.1 unnamed protein product [Adineta steineri]